MIPKTLRVLGKTVRVELEMVKGDKDMGECKHAEALLRVSPKQSEDMRRDTLLHELLHFLDTEMDTKLTERMVRLNATALLSALRDNPALVAYLTATDEQP